MNKNDIIQRAKEYITLESNDTFRTEVEQLVAKNNSTELRERFEQELQFGTGGLRGMIGGGLNRMNSYVVGRATQGLAQYTKKSQQEPIRAVISYDSRRFSVAFAKTVAEIFAGNGICAYIFTTPHPTPLLSYAVRMLKAKVGVMVTASHNPPEYNGYKVYWDDGAQIIAPHDTNIIAEIKNTQSISTLSYESAKNKQLIIELDDKIDTQYIEYVQNLTLSKALVAAKAQELSVVYTPLHGVGADLFKKITKKFGYTCAIVPEQEQPDGEFPTVESPNPENSAAFELALKLGEKNKSDVAIANDPDADRVAVAARKDGTLTILSGNQTGSLLIDYVLHILTENNALPEKAAVIKTIVTTELQRYITESYGATCYNTLTGFKHIAALIKKFETEQAGPQFIFGNEESIGYMFGNEVRDKDGINATMLLLEMALYYKQQGKTLYDRLSDIYYKYGYYEEVTISKQFPGIDGPKKMSALMDRLRKSPPEIIGNISVSAIKDFQTQQIVDCTTGIDQKLHGYPQSNVLQFLLADETSISVRPSGTEPKIKFYASTNFTPHTPLDQATHITHQMILQIEKQIDIWME